MKKKSAITIISICFNLVLFAALAYFNKINDRPETAPAPIFISQQLPGFAGLTSDGHGVALASTMK